MDTDNPIIDSSTSDYASGSGQSIDNFLNMITFGYYNTIMAPGGAPGFQSADTALAGSASDPLGGATIGSILAGTAPPTASEQPQPTGVLGAEGISTPSSTDLWAAGIGIIVVLFLILLILGKVDAL